MRLVTYNVNSIRARLPRLLALLEEHTPDVVCLQETKTSPAKFPYRELDEAGYRAVDHSGGRWSGVAILAREGSGIVEARAGLPGEPSPGEARWIEATVHGVQVASVYVPNGRALGTETFDEKLRFLEALAQRAGRWSDVPAIIAGDMNVCPTDLDVWDASRVHGATHVTPAERLRLAAVLETGYVDAFRHVHPNDPGFTWWDYRAGHFHKGYGLRIDLVLVSQPLAKRLSDATVDREFRKPTRVRESKPSDHAPLIVTFT